MSRILKKHEKASELMPKPIIKSSNNSIGVIYFGGSDYSMIEALDNLYNESYWVSRSYQHRLHKSQIPMLHVTGWYDGTLGGSLQNFPNMRQNGNPKTRNAQYLIIGPWRHWVESDAKNTKIGDIDFSDASKMDLQEIYRKWFDYHIAGKKNEVEKLSLIHI